MNNSDLDLVQQNRINIIRFNRIEKKNAITSNMYAAMATSLAEGDHCEDIRCHLFLGQSGVFSAGNDLKDFAEASKQAGGLGKEVLSFLHQLIQTRKPLIAAVDGLAIGIGTTLLMHCDLVYATERSRFHTPFVDLGVVPEAASSLLGPRRFGHQRAFELLALGEPWSADDALGAGLVNRIVDSDCLESRAMDAASRLADKPQGALALTRELIKGAEQSLAERVELEATHFATQLKTPEAQAAFARFLKPKV